MILSHNVAVEQKKNRVEKCYLMQWYIELVKKYFTAPLHSEGGFESYTHMLYTCVLVLIK